MTALPGRAVPEPILPVTVIAEASACDRALGVGVESFDDGSVWVRHEGAELLHLRHVDGLEPSTNASSASLHVQSVDSWHVVMADAAAPGSVVGDIADMPWGMREFSYTDPSGNRVGSSL